MGSRLLALIRRFSVQRSKLFRLQHCYTPSISLSTRFVPLNPNPFPCWWIVSRNLSYGSVDLVVSDGKPRFEINEIDQPVKEKYRKKKRFKLQKKREKRKRKLANRTDPRRIRPKGKKKRDRFPTAADRIKYKIEKAKTKEALLVERLKKYEVPKLQGPEIEPEVLTGEERFYLKKMGQKKSNYVPVGRRGVFGGLILNMHLHWKKHETVKVICKPCKPGQIDEYAREIARLSGGVPIHTIGNDTIIFYRGKNYVQPEVMSPIDTLSKKKALEKSKYEQSLETVRRFIAIAEKELELYYRHVALYGDPNTRNADMAYGDGKITKKIGTEASASVERSVSLNSEETALSAFDEELHTSTVDMTTDLSDEGTDWTTDDDSITDYSDQDDNSCEKNLEKADIDSVCELSDFEEGLKDEPLCAHSRNQT